MTEPAKPRKKMGRPTTFDPDKAKNVITMILAGNYIETAAAAAGVAKSTLYDWLKYGAAQKSGKYKDFSDAVYEAVAKAEAIDVTHVGTAARSGDWRAAAWRLERRNSKRWGRKEHITIGDVKMEELSTEELEAIVAAARNNQDAPD
jgi:hypothetical protein